MSALEKGSETGGLGNMEIKPNKKNSV